MSSRPAAATLLVTRSDDGSLSGKEIYGPTDHGRLIDGIAFDTHGNLWGTHVMNDGIFAIKPDGDLHIIFDDSNPAEVKRMDDAFQKEEVTAELLMEMGGEIATWCASVTFGGPDLKTVCVGSLRATNIPYFTSPVAGLPMVHWNEKFLAPKNDNCLMLSLTKHELETPRPSTSSGESFLSSAERIQPVQSLVNSPASGRSLAGVGSTGEPI